MLRQVCHPEFYEEMDNQYQEVLPSPSSPICHPPHSVVLLDALNSFIISKPLFLISSPWVPTMTYDKGLRNPHPPRQNPTILLPTPQRISLPHHRPRRKILFPLSHFQN